MKKTLISLLLGVILAGPMATYASVDPYAALSRTQKDALIMQLTGLLHKLLAQIALLEAERGTLVAMSDDTPTPQVSPEVSPETPPIEAPATPGYSGPPGYSSLAI